MSERISSPRGTFDVVDPESHIRARAIDKSLDVLRRYGYREIETPIFEHTELFVRGVGAETDIVSKEMYTFVDQGDVSLTLRPEGTAPVVRAFIQMGLSGRGLPQKLFYRGPMFRRERPQAGRHRQFYQLGAELIGSEDPAADVELMCANRDIFDVLGLSEWKLVLNSVGCRRCRGDYTETLVDFLSQRAAGLCDDCRRRMENNPLRVLDCKKEGCSNIVGGAPSITDYLCEGCRRHFDTVLEEMEDVGMEYELDPLMVRGLDYYTRTAFEFRAEGLGAQNTVSAGGRYDDLAEELGGKPTPAVGFSLGLERMLMAMGTESTERLMPDRLDTFIASRVEEDRREGRRLLYRMRESGISAETDYMGRSLKAQMKHADRLGARLVIIVDGTESTGRVILRDMDTSEQREIDIYEIVETVGDVIEG